MSPLASPTRDFALTLQRDQPDPPGKWSGADNIPTPYCGHVGCQRPVQTEGTHCPLHKENSKKPLATTNTDRREGQMAHHSGTEFRPPPNRPQGLNGRSSHGPKSPSRTMLLSTSRPTVQPPANQPVNHKKVLPGSRVARKSVKGRRSAGRPSLREERLFEDAIRVQQMGRENQKLYAALAEESRRKALEEERRRQALTRPRSPTPSFDDNPHSLPRKKAPTGSNQNGIAPSESSLRPEGTGTGIGDRVTQMNNSDGGGLVSMGFPRQSDPLEHPHATGAHTCSHRSNGPEGAQAPLQVRSQSDSPSTSRNRDYMQPARKSNSPGHSLLGLGRGEKPPAPDRDSGQFLETNPAAKEVRGYDNGMHTVARFAILQPPASPSQNGETVPAASRRTSPKPQHRPGLSTSSTRSTGRTPAPAQLPTASPVDPWALSAQLKSQLATAGSTTKADEFTFILNGLTNPSDLQCPSLSTRHQKARERHDPGKFDSYIYSAENEPFRPGSELFGKPWYELPPRQTRPATYFAHIDPRIHWSQPRTQQWHENKKAEISGRGGRKARLGAAATSVTRRRRDEHRLPDRVENNPAWLAALDELDALVETKRLRELGIGVEAGRANVDRQQKPKPRQKRGGRRKRKLDQQQEQQEAPPPRSEQTTRVSAASAAAQEDESDNDLDEELANPTGAQQRRQRRRKGIARTMIIDDSDFDDGVDDEYVPPMEMDS